MKLSNALSTLRVVSIAFGMIIAFGIPTFGQEAPLQNEASAPAMNEVLRHNIENWALQGRGVPEDWSHHHLVFSNPGTEEEAIANGTHDRWLNIVNDPRYILQQMKRSSGVKTLADPGIASLMPLPKTEPIKKPKPKKGKLKKDWSEPLGSEATATFTVAAPSGSPNIVGTSTLTVDGVIFHASPPTSSTGTITVGSPYCFAGGDGVKINGVNITTNATKVNGTVTFSNVASSAETVVVAGITYTYRGSSGSCGTENATNVCVMRGSVATDSSADLEAAINNSPAQCSATGKTEGGGTTCFFTSPSQANPTVTATISSNVATVIPRCAGNYTMTACSAGHCTVSATSLGSNGSAGAGTFPLPATASNTTVASSMATAIGTETATDFVTAASGGTSTVTLTGQNPGTTDNVSLALDGTPTGLTLSASVAGGTDGTTSGTSTPPTFAYWSGSTYVSQSTLASNIASALNSNTTTDAVLTATANSGTTNNLTISAAGAESGTGGNSITVTASSNFSAFTPGGPTNLSGGTTGTVQPNMWPAKFSFSTTTASCSDFVVYPTGVAGATSAANIIAYSNLYTGGCTAPVPSVYWAYNTGGTVTTSPIISVDGTQVAFVQVVGTTASLVLLKWAAGTGTLSAPATPTLASSDSVYRNSCPAPCYFKVSLTANDTYSAPFYDYIAASDAIYVGDDVGRLHKITGVFYGSTIAEASGWPVTLNSANGHKTASPVFDNTSGYVFVGNSNFTPGSADLYSVGTGWAGTTSGSTHGASASLGDAIVDGPLVDPSAEEVYAFVTTDAAGYNAVYQFPAAASLSGVGSVEKVGYGGPGYYLYSGDFDNVYYSSTNGTAGDLWVVGNTGGSSGGGGGGVNLYRIPINSSGAMTAPFAAISNLTAANTVTNQTVSLLASNSAQSAAAGSSNGSISLNLTGLGSSGTWLLVGVSIETVNTTVSSITWGGTALTRVCGNWGNNGATTNNSNMEIWALQTPSNISSTVAITLNASAVLEAGAAVFGGVGSLGTCVTNATRGSSVASSNSVTIAAPGAGGAVFDTLAVDTVTNNLVINAPPAGQTSLWSLTDVGNVIGTSCNTSNHCSAGGAGSYAGNVTLMSQSWNTTSGSSAYGAVPLIPAETTTSNYGWPSPITEFCNNGTSDCVASGTATTSGTDYLFFSVDGLASATGTSCVTGSGNGCVLSYSINNPTIAPTLKGGAAVTTIATPGCWSTSGIEIDNSATSTGASNIYVLAFNGNRAGGPTSGTYTSSTCGTGGSASPITAYQFSQSAP